MSASPTAADAYRVWVGCLACYNGGHLIGEWFAGADAPQSMTDFNEVMERTPDDHDSDSHDELWVFDHEGSPVRSEYAPMDAVAYAEELENIQPEELDSYLAWLDNEHTPFLEGNLERFREARLGYESLPHYVADIYDGNDELPDWIQPHIWKVYEAMAHDMIVGGDVYTLGGEWFSAH